ncbi:MAG: YlbF family regulator [Lachnospiraceae bacterium]|nr:YlbF family regulator [Lachnospiraceae bacterium]
MDQRIREYTDAYIEQLKTSDEYINYNHQLSVIKNFPDLMEKINAYREENFMIQNRYEGDELFDKMEEFTNKYEPLLENPRVYDFIHSEAAFCRMIQEINTNIVEGLNFQ